MLAKTKHEEYLIVLFFFLNRTKYNLSACELVREANEANQIVKLMHLALFSTANELK